MNKKGVPLPDPKPAYNFRAIYRSGNKNGQPVMGGTVELFEAGTALTVWSYADEDLLIRNPVPVVLNMDGEANIYVASGQRIKIVIREISTAVVQQYEVDV